MLASVKSLLALSLSPAEFCARFLLAVLLGEKCMGVRSTMTLTWHLTTDRPVLAARSQNAASVHWPVMRIGRLLIDAIFKTKNIFVYIFVYFNLNLNFETKINFYFCD